MSKTFLKVNLPSVLMITKGVSNLVCLLQIHRFQWQNKPIQNSVGEIIAHYYNKGEEELDAIRCKTYSVVLKTSTQMNVFITL